MRNLLTRPQFRLFLVARTMTKTTDSSFVHTKCRNTEKPYLKSQVYRFKVPDGKVSWNVPFDDYKPPDYTDESIKGKEWADPEINEGQFKWNELDNEVNRESHFCKYKIDDDERPINPIGRTGLKGRGILGRWGPNLAADPIVSRVLNGQLQFVAIERHDTGEWAIPGGMVDKGEQVSATLKREFTEEALNGVDDNELEALWSKGVSIYKGYVDDHRNTDNAWMETEVVNFHDDSGLLSKAKFKAGDDAKNVRFVDVKPGLELYASHEFFVREFAKRHGLTV